jgi:hypothetical protein
VCAYMRVCVYVRTCVCLNVHIYIIMYQCVGVSCVNLYVTRIRPIRIMLHVLLKPIVE